MMKNNRDYATENINLKQQVIDLKVANKDKAETIKAMKQELLEYNQLRDRFKVLYEENEKRKNAIKILKCFLNYVEVEFDTFVTSQCTEADYILLKKVLEYDQH